RSTDEVERWTYETHRVESCAGARFVHQAYHASPEGRGAARATHAAFVLSLHKDIVTHARIGVEGDVRHVAHGGGALGVGCRRRFLPRRDGPHTANTPAAATPSGLAAVGAAGGYIQ